jgi:hypothetical protein
VIIERRIVEAYRAGEQAARDRRPFRNPWRGDAPTARERVLSIMWARGYSDGNPMPVLDEW